MAKLRTFILAALFLMWLPGAPASAATASLTVVFTNNGEPLPDPSQGRVYIYEEEKRERYLAWADAARSISIEAGTYDIVIRYTNDTIVEERVLESFELSGSVIHEESFSIVPAYLTIEITAGGAPIHVHSGSYNVHVAGRRDKPLASRRPGERLTLRTGRYDIEALYRDPRGLQSAWLNDYLIIDDHLETVDIGVASASLLVSLTYRGIPISPVEGEWEVHRSGDPQPFAGGQSGQLVELPAGTYDVRVFYSSFGTTPLERWVRDVQVEGSTRENIEVIEEAGSEIRVNIRRDGKALREAWFSVYLAGHTETPLTTQRSGSVVDVPAGQYDIQCTYRVGSIRTEKWLRDRTVEGRTEVIVDLPLSTATLTVRPPRRIRDPIERSNVLILLDSSLEMRGPMGGRSRMELVRQTLLDTIDILDTDQIDVGVRVWGIAPRSQNNCQDSTLLMPLAPLDRGGVEQTFELIRPSGFAPIAYSLQKAAADLPTNGRSTVVVITGGVDSCSGDPCDAAARLIRRGRADRVHIIGLDQPKHTETDLECVGTYHAANNRAGLRNSLRTIFREASRSDQGRVTVFLAGRNRWVASGELGQSIQLLEGRYDLMIRAGTRVFHWSDFELEGDRTETAGARP
jgi:hypothetical protein